MALNQIPNMQNAEPQLRFLRAARQFYAEGKRLLSLQLLLTVALPVIGALCTLAWPALKVLVAFLSITIAVLDVTALDRIQKGIRKSAAKTQEEFDCKVLELPWDAFAVGQNLAPEAIHAASSKYLHGRKDPKLRDWYPDVVANAPLHLARIICQRTNLWYDSQLRRQYGAWVLGIAVVLTVLLIGIGIIGGFTLESLVLAGVAPAAPVLIWALREYFRQRDAADVLDHLRKEAEALWERAKTGKCSESECTTQSRHFQNAIYERRSTNPLIYDWIYRRQRPALEDQMKHGAAEFVQQVTRTN